MQTKTLIDDENDFETQQDAYAAPDGIYPLDKIIDVVLDAVESVLERRMREEEEQHGYC